MTPYLRFTSVEKRYRRVTALSGIDLEVDQGSILALLGPNGAGKSTLFGCLLGLTRPTAGHIELRGRPGDRRQTRARFGYTPERVALYLTITVRENGLFFAQLRGHNGRELACQLQRVGLDHVRSRKVRQLSKGMLAAARPRDRAVRPAGVADSRRAVQRVGPGLLDGLREILARKNRNAARRC